MNYRLLLNEISDTSSLVEPMMLKCTVDYFNNNEGLYDKITYTFLEKGFRIRPFLVRMGYEVGGGSFNEILPVAVAVEFMQLATLVIDDILDNSDMRNSRDSVNRKWGIKEAILIGTNLKSLSTLILVESIKKNEKLKNAYDAVNLFENTYKDICIGQYLDLACEKEKVIDESEYLRMIEKSTAVFIQSSIKIGAIMSEVTDDLIKVLSLYGLYLGYAYQIRDDVIDIIGDEKLTGKPFAGDIKRRKKRLPIIHAFSNAPNLILKKLEVIYEKEEINDKDSMEVVDMLCKCGSIDYSINKVNYFCRKAVNEIKGIKNQKVKKLLSELAMLISSFED